MFVCGKGPSPLLSVFCGHRAVHEEQGCARQGWRAAPPRLKGCGAAGVAGVEHATGRAASAGMRVMLRWVVKWEWRWLRGFVCQWIVCSPCVVRVFLGKAGS